MTGAAPSLLAVTVAALQGMGRLVRTDWDIETFDVLAEDEAAEPTLGVVLSVSRSVVFYQVWPDPVADADRERVGEYVLRANTDLYTSAFEFDLDNGTLSVRSGIQLGDLALDTGIDRAAFTALLGTALAEVEQAAGQHGPGVAALLGGASVLDALAIAAKSG